MIWCSNASPGKLFPSLKGRGPAVFSSPEKGEKCTVARFDFIWQIVSNR
jgi:hypothetical protein